MAKRIPLSELPRWARDFVHEQSGGNSACQMMNDGDVLGIAGSAVSFNGKRVAMPGDPLEDADLPPLKLSETPAWVQDLVRKSGPNDMTNAQYQDQSLSIAAGVVIYCGREVEVDYSTRSAKGSDSAKSNGSAKAHGGLSTRTLVLMAVVAVAIIALVLSQI